MAWSVGGVAAWAMNGNEKAALSGFAGAFLAEVFAGLLEPDQQKMYRDEVAQKEAALGRSLTALELSELRSTQLKTYGEAVLQAMDWSKLLSGTVLLLTGQSVTPGLHAADNALNNNFAVQAWLF